MRILVVEDEKTLALNLKEAFEKAGYSVTVCYDGESGLDKALIEDFDLYIIDIMLPKVDGLSLIKEIRKEGIKVPILLLTALASVEDKVKGLDSGADDYLAKPFAMAELMARVRSLIRRNTDVKSAELSVADLKLNFKTRKVFRGKKEIRLTPKEFSILEFLIHNKGNVVTRTAIAEHVWGDNFDLFSMTNFVDVHIKNLRKKIDRGFSPKLIHTRYGLGYVLSEKESS